MTLFDALFGCWHSNFTRPITTAQRGCYVTCLECGREFTYCMARMRVSDEIPRKVTHRPKQYKGDTIRKLELMVTEITNTKF